MNRIYSKYDAKYLLSILMLSFIVLLFFSGLSAFVLLLKIYSGMNLEFMHHQYDYGNWIPAIIYIAIFSFFTLSFLTPMKKRDWRSASIYLAFIIALFTEMFGFPLTIYILSSLFGMQLSFGHIESHLLATMLATFKITSLTKAWALVMVTSLILIAIGFISIYKGWKKIYYSEELVTDGIYKYVRHPQYLGLLMITVGFLIQWPTLITLAMWPILVFMYYRLAKKEEKEMVEKFGEAYLRYKSRVPMFIPLLSLKGHI